MRLESPIYLAENSKNISYGALPRVALPKGDTGGAETRDHRPPSTSFPSLAVVGGLRRAKPGRSGGGRALFLSSAGGFAGELGISSVIGALRLAGGGGHDAEGTLGAEAGGLMLGREGQI
jgi:hypothetical protein